MKRLALIMAVVAVVFTSAAPAFAASSVGDAYGGNGGGILGAVENGGGNGGNGGGTSPASTSAPQTVKVTSSENTLPFTGLDLGLLAIGGIALVGVGVGLRRFARPLS